MENRTLIIGRINRLAGDVKSAGVKFRVGNIPCRAVSLTANLIAEHHGFPGHEVRVEGTLDAQKKTLDVETVELVD